MANVRICDCCGKVVKYVHEGCFREYYIGTKFDGYGGSFPIRINKKVQIDLCQDCYTKLFKIKEEADNA